MPDPLAEADQPDNSGGCMLALYPPPRLAKKLATPDGLPADEIHLTVAYTGNAADVDRAALNAVARQLATRGPVAASISGHARFTGGETDVIVALADGPALEDLRRDAMDRLGAAGIAVPRDHGYTPHMTLRYAASGDPDPVGRLDSTPLTFAGISAVHGKQRTDYPFADDLPAQAREAFAAGWALSGGPMTERVKAGCEAAVAHALEHRDDPGILEVSLHLGRLEGTWATVYQRRDALEAKHRRRIARIWRKIVERLDTGTFLADYLHRAQMPREAASPQDKAAATAALLAWLQQILTDPGYADLAAAITTALVDAIAEGKTALLAVAADQAQAAGFSWQTAYNAMRAAVADLESQPGIADPVVQAILSGVAWDAGQALAGAVDSGATDAEAIAAAEDAIAGTDLTGLDLAVDYGMGGAMGQGALALAAAEGIQLNWMTAGDERVCYTCDANEAGGPYDPADFPSLPAHVRCRCCSSPASPLAISAFADFLVS